MLRSPAAFAGASVLIDGLNRDAVALARVLARAGARVRIAGRATRPDVTRDVPELERLGVRVEPGTDVEAAVGAADVLFVDSILFPGPLTAAVEAARHRGTLVSILADAVLAWSPVPTLAVTGSAGKSSTTAMVSQLLDDAGIRHHIPRDMPIDNAFPNFELVQALGSMQRSDWIVCELTSSHLVYMHTTPDVAVVTNLAPDHVEWHGSLEAYYEAKLRILAESGQLAILNADDATRDVFGPRARDAAWFSVEREVERGVFVRGGEIVARMGEREEPLGPVDRVPVERPYLGNALAACAAALAAGAPAEDVARALPRVEGLRQRLRLVGEVDGVRIWNDGMAITPVKARASLASRTDDSVVLVAGGRDDPFWTDGIHRSPAEREVLEEVARLVVRKARHAVLFGPAGDLVRASLSDVGYPAGAVSRVGTLADAAVEAAGQARAGDEILLAPIFFITPEDGDAFGPLALEAVRRVGSRR